MCEKYTQALNRHTFNNRYVNHQGFALVIALSLMAFTLLLVLSILTLIEVETRSAQTNLHTLKARESARLALTMAIGQLQEHAGHDRRVTARAELLGDKTIQSSTRFWAGAWDATDMDKTPVWLVSGNNPNPRSAPVKSIRLVGPGTVGDASDQYVQVPAIDILNAAGDISSRIGWWISDEGVKASVASLPLDDRPTPNFIDDDNSLQLQLAATHGLGAIFNQYDHLQSKSSKLLDRISSMELLDSLDDFDPVTSGEHLFHALTPGSYGVLASTADAGLMQDLSLFPELLGTGLKNYLQLGETHADRMASKEFPLARKRLLTDMVGLEEIGVLQNGEITMKDGEIAMPIIPVLSNFVIAFTIRTKTAAAKDENFLLRARFFCEFWNPFTHTLKMTDDEGDPIHLELEITGFPEVTVHGTDEEGNPINSGPIKLQEVMAVSGNSKNAVIIRMLNGDSEPWFPGRSKNWVGIENNPSDSVHSPYNSVRTDGKQWHFNKNTLGGDDGIDTSISGFSGNIRHESKEQHTLQIKIYRVTKSSRKLLSTLNGFTYEPIDTLNPVDREYYPNTYKYMTFGYHVMLREPNNSDKSGDFFRGLWLKDHDPRSPLPVFRDDWHLNNSMEKNTGSPYVAIFNGNEEIDPPEPSKIYQSEEGGTIDSDRLERLLDRSKGGANAFHDLWQDAPLFELPRKRVLSLASLQHIYIHNERPFQVGNSWGSQGEHNTLSWFDRYYFSGLSRNDDLADFNQQAGPPNPCLQFVDTNDFLAQFSEWKKDPASSALSARNPAQHFMVANRFNINSTSIDAWKAVLSSLRLKDFSHLNWPNEKTSDPDTLELINSSRKEGSFTRFSHSLEETYQATNPPKSLKTAPSAFYRLGARRFDSNEFEVFAKEIVRLIKKKGRPFESMEAFLSELSPGNGSLLEQAIKKALTHPITGRQQWRHIWETTGQKAEDELPIDIDHFSPGFLTQADVIAAIGPMLAPRSDTFKIRARGESFNHSGELIGSATIEAILQRIPEAIDPSTPLDKSTYRRWKMTSMRWLTDSEL